jgi:hypothetical protein
MGTWLNSYRNSCSAFEPVARLSVSIDLNALIGFFIDDNGDNEAVAAWTFCRQQAFIEEAAHRSYWRRHAQRLLAERGNLNVVSELLKLVVDTSTDAIGLNVGAIHALWTLHGLGALEGGDAESLKTVVSALHHPSAGVRRNAIRVLPMLDASSDIILQADRIASRVLARSSAASLL